MRDYDIYYERVGGAVEIVAGHLGYRLRNVDRVAGLVVLRRRVLAVIPMVLRVHVKPYPGGARVWIEGPQLAARQLLRALDRELAPELTA